MKLWQWIALAASLLALVAGGLVAAWTMLREPEPEWTSRSPSALEELEAGIGAFHRRYWSDAWTHFHRALQLDEDQFGSLFHLYLMTSSDLEARETQIERLRALDHDALNDRERFLFAFHEAIFENDTEAAGKVLDSFRAAHPTDPYGMQTQCNSLEIRDELDRSARCFEDLLAKHPNWVEARNSLGLVEMARQRFDVAEEHFEAYRYVAPDQATPYDSLGQLATLRGRYEEAESWLHQAVELKDDFCNAHQHLIDLHVMAARTEQAREALERLLDIPSCHWLGEYGYFCESRAEIAIWAGDLDAAQQALDDCPAKQPTSFYGHRLALLRGDDAGAQAIEQQLEAQIASAVDHPILGKDMMRAVLFHQRGARALSRGRLEVAAAAFRDADDGLDYKTLYRGLTKMFNQLHLARTLDLLGESQGADRLRQDIAQINPDFARSESVGGLEMLARRGADAAQAAPR
ncbi:MAG: hypothetical protein AAGN46_10510 [Acidobacteriota bacterium]